ncbi:MAG: hypothetical protein AAB582_04010 [Patescibacteria group bacterium]
MDVSPALSSPPPLLPPARSRVPRGLSIAIVILVILIAAAAGAYFTGLLDPFLLKTEESPAALTQSFVIVDGKLYMQGMDGYESVDLGTALPISSMARRDGHLAYITSADGGAYEIRVDTTVRYYTHERQVFSAAVSPNGKNVVFAAADSTAIKNAVDAGKTIPTTVYSAGEDGRSQEVLGEGSMPFFRTDTIVMWFAGNDLVSYDLTTKETKVVAAGMRKDPVLFFSPTVSPDASLLAWAETDGIHIVRLIDGGIESMATHMKTEGLQPVLGNTALYIIGANADNSGQVIYQHELGTDAYGTIVPGLPGGSVTQFVP